jgi:death-on-curing protein
MTAALRHPTVEAVIAIHAQVLAAHGGATGIQSRELLESAIATPQATKMGQIMMADPIEIAAAYFFYLCSNHPFVDGNKHMALATCLIFLSENGLLANDSLEVDAWESLTLNIAAGLLTRDEITAALRNLLR